MNTKDAEKDHMPMVEDQVLTEPDTITSILRKHGVDPGADSRIRLQQRPNEVACLISVSVLPALTLSAFLASYHIPILYAFVPTILLSVVLWRHQMSHPGQPALETCASLVVAGAILALGWGNVEPLIPASVVIAIAGVLLVKGALGVWKDGWFKPESTRLELVAAGAALTTLSF